MPATSRLVLSATVLLIITTTARLSSATKFWHNNTTLLNEHGELVVKHASAKIEGEHPDKVAPITSDATHFLGSEHLNPIILGKRERKPRTVLNLLPQFPAT